MTHTPTPWTVDEYHSVIGSDGKNICANGFSSIMSYGPSMLDARANAAYIVHCVNSHASLVEENKRMREALEVARVYVQEREKDDGYFHQEEASYDLAMIDKALGDTNA